MADISKIANLENGLEVRDKLNSVIDRANEVPAKIDKITTAQPGNVAVWGENGVLLDGGTTPGGGENTNVPSWEDVQYEPLPINYLVQYNGRLFTSKINDNLLNTPPFEGENDYWVETSESVANGTPLYAPGTYLVELAEVFKLNISDNKYYKYLLRQPVPYISSDFDAELLAGHWQILGDGASDITANEIVSLLESLTGDDRLDASAIKNLNAEAAVGGFASNVYFSAFDSDIVGYKRQSSTIDPTETLLTTSVTAANGDKLVNQYVFDSPANTTLIQHGNWSFTFASFVSSAAGDTRVGFRPFRYTSLGDKVYTFDAIVWSKEIDILTTAEYLTVTLIQESKAIELTDRLGCDLYVKTTAATAKTVNIVIGDGQAMFMNVPIAVRHSALRDLNGDSNYVHLTQTEKNSINKIDSSVFNGNLTPEDDTLQKVAQKFDDYVGGGTVTDYENIFFEVSSPDKAYITRGFNWKITSSTEYGGTSTIKTSSGIAYTTGATVTAGDYLTVTNTTINARLVAIIQPV